MAESDSRHIVYESTGNKGNNRQAYALGQYEFSKVQLESARRNIQRCYVYSFDGQVKAADLTIRCKKKPLLQWGREVFDSLGDDSDIDWRKSQWESFYQGADCLQQSYRRASLDEALSFI